MPSPASGNPPSVPFTVTIGKSSPGWPAGLVVQAVDADTGQVYNTATDEITVTTPPGFFAKYRWEIIGVIALIVLALLAAFASWKISRNRRDVRGLVATLRRGGVQAGRELEPEEKWAETFPFIIRDETSPAPRLDHPPKGASVGNLPGQAGRARPGPADDADGPAAVRGRGQRPRAGPGERARARLPRHQEPELDGLGRG